MQVQQAGLEVMSGCFVIVALLIFGIGGAILRQFRAKNSRPQHSHVIRLLTDFASGNDRSWGSVKQIRTLLMTTFANDRQYEELRAAVGTFVPGGVAPFHDEAWLAEVFREFLRQQGIVIPEKTGDPSDVWPPPPTPPMA